MKTFTIRLDHTGAIEFENDGMSDYEIIGIMQLIEADLRVRFASTGYEERLKAQAVIADESSTQEETPSVVGES